MNRIFVLLLATFGLAACGSDQASNDNEGMNISVTTEDGEETSININLDDINLDKATGGLADALEKASESLRQSADGEAVELMDFRDIKDVMPNRLLWMDRTEHNGEKNAAFGFGVSQARATYESDDKRLEVVIVDGGNIGIAQLGAAAWAGLDIDKETDNGYERTTEIDGYKAFEKWDSRRDRGELVLLYEGRYIITLTGRNLDEDDLRKALNRIDYDKLE